MKRIDFLLTTIIILFPMTTGAVPQLLTHQGYMSETDGTPSSGSANVTFNLYTVETDGSSMWTQTTAVTFDSGYYSVILGPGTPELSTSLFDVSELYLGVTLEGQDEFLPRMMIASVPYAFRAGAVEGEVKAVGGLVIDGVEVINDQQQWLGSNISFNDLADIPSDLADGDDVGLEGSGTDGTLAKFTESGVGDSVVAETDGKLGIGTTDPQSTFHVAGGVQIGDDSDDCVTGKEGSLRWHENAVEVCDGTSWEALGSTASYGQSQTQSGDSCKHIFDSGSSQGDDIYWIDPNGGDRDDAFQAYCDMTNEGWTLLGKQVAGSGSGNWTGNGVLGGFSSVPMPGSGSGTTARFPFAIFNEIAATNPDGAFKATSDRTNAYTSYWRASCVIVNWDTGSDQCYQDFTDYEFTDPRRTVSRNGGHGVLQGYGGHSGYSDCNLSYTSFQVGATPAIGYHNGSGSYAGYQHNAGVMIWFK